MKRSAALLTLGVGTTLLVSGANAAPVQLASFDNFALDTIYGSWGAPFATLTSGADRYTIRSHHYGSGYEYLGAEFDAAGNDTLKLEVTVTEGVAGCLVDLVDANNNGIAFRFYGLVPGGGTDGGNDYTLFMPLSAGTYFTGTGVLDTTRISQMHIEIDPGPSTDFYTASFNDLTLITAAVSSTWTGGADSDWSNTANWSNGVPNGVGATASFAGIGSGQFNVNVDGGSKTAGTINFDNASSYTLGGAGPVILQAASGQAVVNVTNGSHTIAAPLSLNSATTINVAPASSTLTVSALQSTAQAVTKTGSGNLAVNAVRAGALSVNSGTVTVLAGGTDASASNVATLALAGGAVPTATLDLNDNDLVVTGGSIATISSQVAAARNGGGWDAHGLTSSAARNQSSSATTLGVLGGADYISVNGTSFDGFSVAAADVLVKYTWYGDTDFNGVVDFDDYVRTDAGFNSALSGWFNGDFDLNGSVDFDDYVLLDLGFNAQNDTLRRAMSYIDGSDRSLSGMDAPALRKVVEHFETFGAGYGTHFLSAVPEPGTALILGLPALVAVAGRRRRGAA